MISNQLADILEVPAQFRKVCAVPQSVGQRRQSPRSFFTCLYILDHRVVLLNHLDSQQVTVESMEVMLFELNRVPAGNPSIRGDRAFCCDIQ